MANTKPARAIAVAAALVAFVTVLANVAVAQGGYYAPTELKHWYDRGYPGG
jgi:hypothetical protein